MDSTPKAEAVGGHAVALDLAKPLLSLRPRTPSAERSRFLCGEHAPARELCGTLVPGALVVEHQGALSRGDFEVVLGGC